MSLRDSSVCVDIIRLAPFFLFIYIFFFSFFFFSWVLLLHGVDVIRDRNALGSGSTGRATASVRCMLYTISATWECL